jgi:hypothetical protein
VIDGLEKRICETFLAHAKLRIALTRQLKSQRIVYLHTVLQFKNVSFLFFYCYFRGVLYIF